MNNCKTIQNDFIPYLVENLDENKMRKIDKHLTTCSVCAGFMAELHLSFQLIEEEKFTQVDNLFFIEIENRLAPPTKPNIKIGSMQWLGYAAAFAIGLFAGSFIVDSLTTNLGPVQQQISSDDFYWNDLDQEPIESFFINQNLF